MSLFAVNLFKCIKSTSLTPVGKFCKRPFTIYYDFDKKCSEPNCNIKNRSVTCTRTLSGDEIISVLETALGLKGATKKGKLLQNTQINFLIENSCIVNLLSAIRAASDMGASIVPVYSNTLCVQKRSKRDLNQLGKFISEIYNVICISSTVHSVVEAIADGSTSPVINIGSCFHAPIDAFSCTLTFYEQFKKLRGLTVAIIASPNAYVNSLICLLPRIGVNVRVICLLNNEVVSVRYLELAQRTTKFNETTLKECTSIAEVIEGADCIVLACEEHLKTQLKLSDFNKSAKDWKLVCKLPADNPVEPSILDNERNISFSVLQNTHFIYSALYLRVLGIDFQHGFKIK